METAVINVLILYPRRSVGDINSTTEIAFKHNQLYPVTVYPAICQNATTPHLPCCEPPCWFVGFFLPMYKIRFSKKRGNERYSSSSDVVPETFGISVL